MSRWWRAYDEAVDDPKLQKLPAEIFRGWFNICCITSQNGGALPSADDIAFKLRTTPAKVSKLLNDLRAAGLIDDHADGNVAPHNWAGRQFKSDTSTDRVRRFRNGQRNVPGNVSVLKNGNAPETEQRQRQIKEPIQGKNGSNLRGALS